MSEKPPCECIQKIDGRWTYRCECSNGGSAEYAASWVADENAQDEIARLTAENFSLASWQCEFTDGKTGLVSSEGGSTYCAMAKRVEAFRAEVDSLKSMVIAQEKLLRSKDANHREKA